MAEDRKPLADELGIPFYGQLMGMATGTEKDLYDAAYISRQYGLESEFKDEDRTSDSLRHILLGGLVYGDDSKESILGQAGRGIAGALADFREGDTPEDLIDLNNNEFGRKLREKYPDREEFIAKAKEIADSLYADGELPEIDGISPLKSYGSFETPERLAKFEEENKKQVMERGPDGNWQFTEQAKKEREAAGLNKGGLMAADGVDVQESKSVDDLSEEFDPFESVDTISVRYLDPTVEVMDERLELAFRDYANGEIDRDTYARTVQNVQKHNPEKFNDYFLGPNTDARIKLLNYEAFSDNPLPHMQEESDDIPYSLTMPFGSEGDNTLGGSRGLRGAAVNDTSEIFVAGDEVPEQSFVARHEMRHVKHGNQKGVSHSEEEDRIRAFDALHAVLNQDMDALNTIFDVDYGVSFAKNKENFPQFKRWFNTTLRNRVQDAVNLLPQLYWTGVFDKSKADKELVRQFLEDYDRDEQGFIDSLFGGDPEKQKDVSAEIKTSSTDAKKLAKLLSTAPFVKEISQKGSGSTARVSYDIDREAAEMDEGGLMADPLVLSETAEEEAESKMGIGDYIEAAKELITDFSPAGTAQSMIDAADEAYKLMSGAEDASFMDFGIAAIGALPGGKTATKVVDNATKIADEIAEASLEISKLDNYVPKKTVKAYKLFTKGEDENLYPLFVDANKPLPVGEWIKANMPDYIFQAKNGRYYVPSKATAPKTETGKKAFYDTGERKATGSSVEIPDDPELRKKLVEAGFIAKEGTKSVKAVAARPGWHAGDVPIAHHIGAMIDPATGGTKKLEMPNVRRDDQVWAEVELPADVDWQQEALRRANIKKDGEIDVGTAHITDMVPHGGSYRYKTNPNMTGEWLIGGELKINRVLSDDEVKAINNAAGVEDLPRYSEFMDQYVKPKTELNAGGLMLDEYNRAES